jgi:hypothetical protein
VRLNKFAFARARSERDRDANIQALPPLSTSPPKSTTIATTTSPVATSAAAAMSAHRTVADGYSRTDQRVPVATSTTPVSPPLECDYNDGIAPNAFDDDDVNDVDNYGSTSNGNNDDYDYENEYDALDDDDDDDDVGTGIDNHLPHPSRPRLLQTHEGEHRHDFGDSSSSSSSSSSSRLKVTRSTMIYAACASLNSCNLGYDIGVNTGAGPLLQTSMGLSDVQLGIFMGSMNLFAMIGALSSHHVSDKFGRRWSFRIAALGFIFGTMIQSVSSTYGGLMLGRSFVGYGVGFGLAVDPVYIGEISQAAHRGMLVTWSEIATNVGILLGFVSGLAFSDVNGDVAWRWMFSLGAILPCFVIYFSVSGEGGPPVASFVRASFCRTPPDRPTHPTSIRPSLSHIPRRYPNECTKLQSPHHGGG